MKKYIAIIAAALIFASCGATTESQSGSDITTTSASASSTEIAADKTSDSTSQSKTENQSDTVGSSGISVTEGETPKAAEATVSAAVTPTPQTQAPATKPETQAPAATPETQATTKATSKATTAAVTKATTKATTRATTKATEKPVTTTAATTAKEIVVSDSDFADEVIRLVNIERVNGGLEPLIKDEALTSAALVRAVEIQESFSHTRPNGSSPFTAITEAGGSFSTMGENIAYGYATPESVVEGWMNSEGHRANIMNSAFKYIGVGYYKGSSHNWTQFFGG